MRWPKLLALAVVMAVLAFEAFSVRAADAQARIYGCSGDCTQNSLTLTQVASSNAIRLNNLSRILLSADTGAQSYIQAQSSGADIALIPSQATAVVVHGVNGYTDFNYPVCFKPAALPTCTQALEGLSVKVAGSAGTKTKDCLCTWDGTTAAWVNRAAVAGTNTSCT